MNAFFAVFSSERQIAQSNAADRELVFTPIAKDALVFYVNKSNLVSSLAAEQMRAIYLKEIINWNAVGGDAGKIMAFQHSADSDSQTAMMNMVMKGLAMPSP